MTQPKATPSIEPRNDWKGPAPSREWVCYGWLPQRLILFTGHGGAGKSRIALQLAAAVASKQANHWIPPPDKNTPPLSLTVAAQGEPVLLASWEDEEDEVHRRLANMAKTLPWAASDQIEDRLNFADLSGGGALWDRRKNNGVGLTTVGEALRAAAEEIKARLLIIDPRAAAYAGDENHRAQVRAFISHWDRWARDQNCAVLLLDHLPKSSTMDKFLEKSGASYAGSTDWHNAARCVLTLDEKQVLRCEKSNYGATPPPVRLTSEDGYAWTGVTNPRFGESEAPHDEPARNPFGAD